MSHRGLLIVVIICLAVSPGCSAERPINTTVTSTPTATATTTPEPPKMTRVFASEEGIPTKKNPISFIIEYKNFDANSKYQIRATVNSDGGTATASRQVQKKHGFYLGKTGLVIKPPNGTSKGATIEYRVVLLENGTIVDSNEGHIFDYEEALD